MRSCSGAACTVTESRTAADVHRGGAAGSTSSVAAGALSVRHGGVQHNEGVLCRSAHSNAHTMCCHLPSKPCAKPAACWHPHWATPHSLSASSAHFRCMSYSSCDSHVLSAASLAMPRTMWGAPHAKCHAAARTCQECTSRVSRSDAVASLSSASSCRRITLDVQAGRSAGLLQCGAASSTARARSPSMHGSERRALVGMGRAPPCLMTTRGLDWPSCGQACPVRLGCLRSTLFTCAASARHAIA